VIDKIVDPGSKTFYKRYACSISHIHDPTDRSQAIKEPRAKWARRSRDGLCPLCAGRGIDRPENDFGVRGAALVKPKLSRRRAAGRAPAVKRGVP